MPTLPWTERRSIDPEVSYVVMYTRLPLARYRSIPAFLRDTLRVQRQLATASGRVGYALKADLVHKRFWTVSV